MAVADGRVYARSYGAVHALDESLRDLWPESVEVPFETASSLLIQGERILVSTSGNPARTSRLDVLSATDGRFIASLGPAQLGGFPSQLAIGEGILAVSLRESSASLQGSSAEQGGLAVLGQTAASPTLKVTPSTLVPDPLHDVSVTLEGAPGLLGGSLHWNVDWGDGTRSRGFEGAEIQHTYLDEGLFEATFKVVTSEGQERTTRLTFDVGGRAEPPTFLEAAFNQENQETSFFVLGLLATLMFAGFGVVRLRRRRSLLAKELEAVDHEVRALGDDAPAVREALRQRRNRARRLFLEGRLDEGSTSLLERHIDEKLRDHRLGAAEKEFAFLPYALFRAMQEILRDARVNDWELENFKERLDAEPKLTATERKKVRRRVKAWHAEDRV